MKTLYKILIALTFLSLTGCEDVITVGLDTAPPRLVIDASIDWVKGTTGNEQMIKLSTTTGYYSDTFPTVSGAVITVTNTANTVFTFAENANTGEYLCNNFEPVIGETYTMTILLNGETYSAIETLTGTPDIQPNIDQNNTGGITGDEVEIIYSYQDVLAQENFYLNRIVSPRVVFPEFEVEDDKFTDGNLMSESYSHEDLRAGDLLNIRLYGISKQYHMYFSKLLTASGGNGSPFQTIPTAVRGNIINQTNSQNFAFGYFRLAEVSTVNYTVQ